MILFAFFGPRRLLGPRLLLLVLGTAFTLYAHSGLESPAMQSVMWAGNRSLDPHAAGLHNVPDVRSPTLGAVAVAVSTALNVTAAVATGSMLRQYVRLRRSQARRRLWPTTATTRSTSRRRERGTRSCRLVAVAPGVHRRGCTGQATAALTSPLDDLGWTSVPALVVASLGAWLAGWRSGLGWRGRPGGRGGEERLRSRWPAAQRGLRPDRAVAPPAFEDDRGSSQAAEDPAVEPLVSGPGVEALACGRSPKEGPGRRKRSSSPRP